MKIKENTEITFNWFEAFNEHDIEKLLSLYHEDAQHYSPKLKIRYAESNGVIGGKEALRDWWSDAFDRLPDLQYEIISFTVNKDFVQMVYKRTVKNEPDMEVNEVLNIKDGLIISSAIMDSHVTSGK
ncbi:MAG: nuclear transport factor 2 family protein [Bacteroidota bacterium]